MESHIRIKFTANLIALQQLECSTFKVLMYLAGRSNHYGTCFPYAVTIADGCSLDVKTVYKALGDLETCGYIKVLRKAFHNRFTNESTPPLFQVSPHYLEIADEFYLEALSIWTENGNGIFSMSNQQQEPTAVNNDNNQPQKTTTTINNDSEKEVQTANRKPQKPTTKQRTATQQSENRENSAIVKNYTNPISVNHALEPLSESLAEKIANLEIKIILARGFIAQYGYQQCEVAYNHLQYLLTRQQIENPSGFYRYLLQSNMANILPSMRDKSDNSKPHEYDEYLES